MSWLRLIGTHLHLSSNIVDFAERVAEAVFGLPDGGTEGQVLIKDSGADGDASWGNIEGIATAETDDTLVLAPDGAGGVEFRAEAGGTAYDTVEDEGTPLTQRSTINFVGAGVSAADTAGVTTVTISGGGGSGTGRFYIPFGSGDETYAP